MLATLVGIFGPRHFQLAEDALHDAFSRALTHWQEAVPSHPSGWIIQTAKNQAIDVFRAVKRKQETPLDESLTQEIEWASGSVTDMPCTDGGVEDNLLRMIFMCCHADVKAENRIPLILRSLCGFSLPAISRALVIPQTTVKKRLFRTREHLRDYPFEFPPEDQVATALDSVHTVLYLLFNEGFHSSDASAVNKLEFCRSAMGLVDPLVDDVRFVNQDSLGLMALMHLHMARNPARVDAAGHLVPINLQDRRLWDPIEIKRADGYLGRIPEVPEGPSGRFLIEALIAREHCSVADFEHTDWRAIVNLYDRLVEITQSPVAELNRAIAVGYAGDLEAALQQIRALSENRQLEKSHQLWATAAHFHAMSGDGELAHDCARVAMEKGGTPHEHRVMMRHLECLLTANENSG